MSEKKKAQKKQKWEHLDSYIIFYYNLDEDDYKVKYNPGGTKAVISTKEMGGCDTAFIINLGPIRKLVEKLENESFTRMEVSRLTKLDSRLIKFYTDENIIIPEIDEGKGRGRVRRYSARDVGEFALIKRLVSYGMTLKTIRHFLEDFRKPALGIMDRLTGGVMRRV